MRGDLTRRLEAEIRRDPDQRNVDIAREVGCTQAYVSTTRQRLGLAQKRIQQHKPERFELHADNVKFLRDEAKGANVSMQQMLNAIITDARLEAEDEQTG